MTRVPDSREIRNDIERDIGRADGKTLWRVGRPRLSDTWLDSFTRTRGSGGLGSGVYGYTTRAAAEADSSAVTSPEGTQPIIALRGALKRPLILNDIDKTVKLHKFAGTLSLLARRERQNPGYIADIRADVADRDDDAFVFEFSDSWFSEPEGIMDPDYRSRFQRGLSTFKFAVSTGGHFGTYDEWRVLSLALDACETAANACDSPYSVGGGGGCLPPMNYLLYPQYDGVYPLSDAGGSRNKWGAVVFQQKVEECVGRDLAENREVDPDRLNECFDAEA